MNACTRLGWLVASAAITLATHAVWAGDLLKHNHACEPPSGTHSCDSTAACKTCKQVPATKKVTRIVYESKVEWYCLSKCPCPLHVGKHNCCDPCGKVCTSCDTPRCRRVLVKKVITEEQPTMKCVVE